MAVYTSTDYEIYDSVADASIRVSTTGDSLVRIKTRDDKDSEDYYGKFDVSMNAETAEAVARAVLKVVEDLKKEGYA